MSGRVWQCVAQGDQNRVKLFGIKIGLEHWTETGKYADVIHPRTGRRESVPVYRIIVNGDILQQFAALRLGGTEWAFSL